MCDIAELLRAVVQFRDERGWVNGHTPENLAKSISIEAAELLELFQWHPPTAETIGTDPSIKERIAEELADILIYSFSLSERAGIDIPSAILDKLAKNKIKYPLPKAD